uniref:Odorant binding protein 31 n=1 Tax=Holotrichia parallela TaxID=93412 RepID=A0A0S2UXC3_HOLPA|nr:odorant binding protein 31 [Holotrichia parallela]
MKYIFLFFVILTLTKINCAELPELTEECMTELGISWSQMKEFGKMQFENIELPHNFKCLTLCMAKKSGHITHNQLNETAVLKDLPSGVTVDLEQCRGITGTTDCDKFYKIYECILKQFSKNTSK